MPEGSFEFCYSYAHRIQTDCEASGRQKRTDNETGDHLAEVAELERDYVSHFTNVFCESFTWHMAIQIQLQVNKLVSIATAYSGNVSVFSMMAWQVECASFLS